MDFAEEKFSSLMKVLFWRGIPEKFLVSWILGKWNSVLRTANNNYVYKLQTEQRPGAAIN